MEREMDNLRNITDHFSIPFQQVNIFTEKLQTLSDGLKDLATQLKFLYRTRGKGHLLSTLQHKPAYHATVV